MSSPTEPSAADPSPTDTLGYLAHRLVRASRRHLTRALASHGVVPGQLPVLMHLYEHEKSHARDDSAQSCALSQRDLARLISVEQPTMANTLRRMERDGLVRIEPDADDRRVRRIQLTETARGLRSKVVAAASQVNALTVAGLSPEQVGSLHTQLLAMVANLER